MRRACVFCKKYGATIEELAKKLNVCTATIQHYHDRDALDDFIASGKKPISKCAYRDMYGFSIAEIAKMLNKDKAYISRLHHSGKLREILSNLKISE